LIRSFAILSVLFSFCLQDEDSDKPSDNANADMRYATNTLFEMSEEDVLVHCTKEAKCLCSRSFRGQAYHAYSQFVHVHGRGNQLRLKPPVLAYYRAAWYFDRDVPKTSSCPALDESVIAALQDEPNPSEETVLRFYDVLRRVYG